MSLAADTTPVTTPATNSATAPLTVEVSVTVSVEETVDLVALFSRMDKRAQKRYFALDRHEFSIDAEWERPLAYLWPDEDALIPLTLVPGNPAHPRGDIDDADVRVLYRNGVRLIGSESQWCEDDYLRLAARVPWLAAHTNLAPPSPSESADIADWLAADAETELVEDKELAVEVTATFGVEETVDLAASFNAMSQRERARYVALDLSEVGFDFEWERPMAFLWPEDDDVVPHSMVPGSPSPVLGDVNDATMRVVKRGGKSYYGQEAQWTEDDFLTLADHVPWLKKHLSEQTMSEHDRARLPGPDDVPLFA